MTIKLTILILLITILSRCNSLFHHLPTVACPLKFKYKYQLNREYYGLITLHHMNRHNIINLYAEFSQKGPLQTTYKGDISLYRGLDYSILHMPLYISYRIDFPDPKQPPKLTKIYVNEVLVCSGEPYTDPYATTIRLQHVLDMNHRTERSTVPEVRSAQSTQIQDSYAPVNENSICGQKASTAIPFVYGGSAVARNQYPWLIPIFQKQNGLRYRCVGSLISSRTIITAAHCFIKTNTSVHDVIVYIGRYDLNNFSEDNTELREIRELIIHPEYDNNKFPDADIALLKLKTPVTYSQYVRPICLWTNTPTTAEDLMGVVAGWGSDENGNYTSSVPKEVNVKIVSEGECLRSEMFVALTSPRTICAGNLDNTGPCVGDSGAGLMIKQNDRWLIRGIVSTGVFINNICDLNKFVIYCDLAKHQEWIQNNIS